MAKIYTVTFNPALDVSGETDKIVANEKSYIQNEIHTPGGNGINAGIIAHRLKSPVIVSGFLGGPNGEEIKDLLSNQKIDHRFIKISGHTRMNLTVSLTRSHLQTRLSFPGPKISPIEFNHLNKFLKKIKKNDLVVFGGSLPPGITRKMVSKCIVKIQKRGIRCLVDMPGELLKEVIKARPYFIKPNITEFGILVGSKNESLKSVLKNIKKLHRYVPVICVSSVEGGAVLSSPKSCWFGKIPQVKVMSTVGAGDSMVGAICSVLLKNPDAESDELLRLGLAASCATLTEPGMVLGSRKSIEHYKPKIILTHLE